MKERYSIKELSELCGISKQAVSKRIRTLQIKTEKHGGMIWVSGQDAEKLINAVPTANRQPVTANRQPDGDRQPEDQPQNDENPVNSGEEAPTEESQPPTANHQPQVDDRQPQTANQQLIDELRRQLEDKQREIERLQAALELEQNNSRLALESLRASQTLQARSQGLLPDLTTVEDPEGSRTVKRAFWKRILWWRSS